MLPCPNGALLPLFDYSIVILYRLGTDYCINDRSETKQGPDAAEAAAQQHLIVVPIAGFNGACVVDCSAPHGCSKDTPQRSFTQINSTEVWELLPFKFRMPLTL